MVQQQLKPYFTRFSLLPLCCILLVLLGGSAALLLQAQQQTHAAAIGNIIGPPTLPAATVDSIFARLGSPMVGTGQVVEQAAQQANIDDAFALGVWWTETNDGAAGVGFADRNPGSMRGSPNYPAAYDGYTVYPSYADGIIDWFNILRSRYVSRGLTSVYTLCYPYVGTSSALLWANKVVNLMLRYQQEVPPVVIPTMTPNLKAHKAMSPQVQLGQQWVQPAQGQQQEARKPLMVSSLNTITVQPAPSMLPRPIELPFVTLGMLAAIVIALWSVQLRRMQPPIAAIMPVTESLMLHTANTTFNPVTPPPLFVNQYSPVRAMVAVSERRTEQLSMPVMANTQSRTANLRPMRRIVLQSTQEQAEVEQLSFPTMVDRSNRGGLLRQYSNQ